MLYKKNENFVKCLSKPPSSRTLEDISCIKAYLKTIEALSNYKDLTISEYARIARYESLHPNEVLYKHGDKCTSWYIVLSGCVLVNQTMYFQRKCFGRRYNGNLLRTEESIVLEETELIVFDYSQDRQVSIPSKKMPNVVDPSLHVSNQSSLLLLGAQNSNKRASHASDTSSGYSGCCDAQNSSSLASDTTSEDGCCYDEDEEEDEEEEEFEDINDEFEVDKTNNQNKTKTQSPRATLVNIESNKSINKSDLFYESLMKDPSQRSEQDIDNLVDGVKNLAAFVNLTERSRVELCKVMRPALVEHDSDELMLLENGQVLDTWNVILEGAVELRDDQNCLVKHYSIGDSFGVKPNFDEPVQYQQGDIRTIVNRCVFFCAAQQHYFDIIKRNADTIIPETVEDGRQVLVYEQRNTTHVIVRGTPDKLLYSLIFDRYNTDPCYSEDFLLMYRVFVNSPAILAQKLIDWYKFYQNDKTVQDNIRRCIVMWANNHFHDLDNPNCEMTRFLEKFDEIFIESGQYLYHMACSTYSKQRIFIAKSIPNETQQQQQHHQSLLSRARTGSVIKLVGCHSGFGLFVADIDRNMLQSSTAWDIRRGDQILILGNLNWEVIGSLDKAQSLLNNRLADGMELKLKYNPHEFQELMDLQMRAESSKNQSNKTDDSSSNDLGLSGSNTLHGLSEHMRAALHSSITPMAVPRPNEFTSPDQKNPSQVIITKKNSTGSFPSNNKDVKSQDIKNPRSANTSPHRQIKNTKQIKQHPIKEKQKRAEQQKLKPLNNRSSSNPNLKDVSSPVNANSPRSGDGSSPCYHHKTGSIESQVIKIFRPQSNDYKLVNITNVMCVQETMPLILREFGINPSEIESYALYMVTVNYQDNSCCNQTQTSPCPFTTMQKTSRLSPFMRDLAGHISLNKRYYLKNNAQDTQLISAEQADNLLNESKINISQLSAEELATRITHMDYSLFRNIDAAEYVNYVFKLPQPHLLIESTVAPATNNKPRGFSTGCSNYLQFEEIINRESFWPCTEICSEPNLTRRAELIKKFIKIAKLAKKLKNYNLLMCLVMGLSLTPVNRLKSSWDKVPSKYRKMFDELACLMDMSFNFRKVRQLLSPEVTEPPLIPCLAIHSKDLTLIDLGNKTITGRDQLVNFEKLRTFASEVRKLIQMCNLDYSLNTIIANAHHSKINSAANVTMGFFNFNSSNNNNNSNNNNGQTGEETASDFSNVSGNSKDILKQRSNSVDHPVNSDLNRTLKRRNFNRKSISLSESQLKTPKKSYDEWLSTLKVRTYWDNALVIQDIKRLQEMSEALEPSNIASTSSLSTNTTSSANTTVTNTNTTTSTNKEACSNSVVSNGSVISGTTDSGTGSLSSGALNPSPKSTVTINLHKPPNSSTSSSLSSTKRSPTSPTSSALTVTKSSPSPVLRHPHQNTGGASASVLSAASNHGSTSRPPSIFSYQTIENNNKLRELILNTRRLPKQHQQQQQQYYNYQNHHSYAGNTNQPSMRSNSNTISYPRHIQLNCDDNLLRNYLPMYRTDLNAKFIKVEMNNMNQQQQQRSRPYALTNSPQLQYSNAIAPPQSQMLPPYPHYQQQQQLNHLQYYPQNNSHLRIDTNHYPSITTPPTTSICSNTVCSSSSNSQQYQHQQSHNNTSAANNSSRGANYKFPSSATPYYNMSFYDNTTTTTNHYNNSSSSSTSASSITTNSCSSNHYFHSTDSTDFHSVVSTKATSHQRKQNNRPEPPAYESILSQRLRGPIKPSTNNNQFASVAVNNYEMSPSQVVVINSRPPPVPPSYNEHMMNIKVNTANPPYSTPSLTSPSPLSPSSPANQNQSLSARNQELPHRPHPPPPPQRNDTLNSGSPPPSYNNYKRYKSKAICSQMSRRKSFDVQHPVLNDHPAKFDSLQCKHILDIDEDGNEIINL